MCAVVPGLLSGSFQLALGNVNTQEKNVESDFQFFFSVFQQSHGIEVKILDKDKNLCLYANLTVDFSVAYEGTDNKVSLWFQ